MPTLVLGGRDDPFFPEPVLRATAAAIPGARVEVHAGGHGVPKHHSRWLQDEVATFLRHRPARWGRDPAQGRDPTVPSIRAAATILPTDN